MHSNGWRMSGPTGKADHMNLQDSTAITANGSNLSAEIDPEWSIWGPIGGYIAAIAVRAAGLAAPPGHRPVTLTCQYLSRAEAGPISIQVETLKTGSTAFFNVRLEQGDKTFLQAQVCTTAKTDGPSQICVTAPEIPHPDSLETFASQLERHGHQVAGFWKNVEGRQVDFRSPGEPDPRGNRGECWLRFNGWDVTNDPFLDAARATINIDTQIWRAYNRGQSAMPDHVAPSLDLTVWFHDAAPESQWQLAEARADVAAQALLAGTVRIWSESGKLVASGGSQCLFVPIKRG